MLTNSLKSSDTTKTEFFELIFFQSDLKIWQIYCRADLSSVSDILIYWLSVIFLKRGFLGLSVTTLFQAYNLRTKSPMSVIFFFSRHCKFFVDSWNSAKNSENIFLIWGHCIWIVCVRHLLLVRKNTFHRVWIC